MALPLLLLLLWYSSAAIFAIVLGAVAVVGLQEYFKMGLPAYRRTEWLPAALCGGALVPLWLLAGPQALLGALASLVMALGVALLFRYRDLQTVIPQLALLCFGFLYVPLLLGHAALLRGLPHGRELVLLVLAVIMAGDSAAYFSGVTLGRRKLYPAISPNKSVEGAIGGLIGSLGGALLVKFTLLPLLSIVDCMALGVGLGVLGQLGDLFESMLKRCCGVKDSGALIPGHGGVLDRLDSLLFAFPAAYYYAAIFVVR